jgi:hypothetical protein
MKRLLLAAVLGLALCLSAGAQTTTDQTQEPAQKERKAKPEQFAKPSEKRSVDQSVQPKEHQRAGASEEQNAPPSTREGARTNEQRNVAPTQRQGAGVQEQGGKVSHSTTVFRNGRQTNESISLRHSFRDQSDVHFQIGTHPRDWWLRTYTIVLMDGCHYYLADDGCWYPAYGFDPSCNYPQGVVYCE